MNEQPIHKTEVHITTLPREIDQYLAIALGEMVVAFGRLEDMFKVAIKRFERNRTLDQVLKDFNGQRGTLGFLINHCRTSFPLLCDSCVEAEKLNVHRQDFIHATFAATEDVVMSDSADLLATLTSAPTSNYSEVLLTKPTH